MPSPPPRPLLAALLGAPIGALGGLIGLGGAEFRLPILTGTFRLPIHQAVALNLAVSLVTLAASLVARLGAGATVSPALAPTLLALTAGAMTGAWLGARAAERLSARRLGQVVVLLLVTIGVILAAEGWGGLAARGLPGGPPVWIPAALAAGGAIGLVSSLLGVAGGELLIPTLVLLFAVEVKAAGTASVLVSLPTVAVGCWRHARGGAYRDRSALSALVLPMGLGSIVGAFAGGLLVPWLPSRAVKLGLAVILIVSAVRMQRHLRAPPAG